MKHPWNDSIWDLLTQRQGAVPQAVLFHGANGLGKNALAVRFAHHVLCGMGPNSERFGAQFEAGTHPDFHVVAPEQRAIDCPELYAQYARRYFEEAPGAADRKAKTVIGVDQVRMLIDRVGRSAHFAAAKVALITPAESMNINSANALLKLLEEPPSSTTLILVADDSDRLPATIISRCMLIPFTPPRRSVAQSWLSEHYPELSDSDVLLDLTANAPLAAAALAESGFLAQRDQMLMDFEAIITGGGDPVASAGRWGRIGAAPALKWLQQALSDLIRWQHDVSPPTVFNPDRESHFQALANKIDFKELFRLLQVSGEARLQVGGALDEILLLEDVLVQLQKSTTV